MLRGGAADACVEGRVVDGNGFGVLVLSVVFLGVDLFVLLQVLRTLEGLVADFAYMWFQRDVD